MGNVHTKKYFDKMAANGLIRVHPRIPAGAKRYLLNIAGKMRDGAWSDDERQLTKEYVHKVAFDGDIIMVHPFIPSASRDEFMNIAGITRASNFDLRGVA